MSLELDPVELGFRRPFDREVEEKLRLRNPNTDPVAFKVKTTAPKQYCVRPNSGRIEAGQTVDVSVLLQKMTEEPPLDAKCRDKFLVQSVAVSASDEISNVQAVWSNIEQTSRSSIQEKKIRVNFLPASGTNGIAASTPARQSTGAYAGDEPPPSYSSPLQNQTPSSQTYGTYDPDSANSAVKSGPYDASSGSRGIDDTNTSSSGAADPTTYSSMATGAVAGAAQSVANAVPTSTEQVRSLAGETQAQVSSLASQANEGIRQRKSNTQGATSSGSGGSLATMQAPSGVPVPLVAALCLLSFLLAYLLF